MESSVVSVWVAADVAPALKVSLPESPVITSMPVVRAKFCAAAVVVVVVVDELDEDEEVLESSSEPQAANDRAIRETPPARAAFAFFFSQTAANFSANVGCLLEASISV